MGYLFACDPQVDIERKNHTNHVDIYKLQM